MAYGLDDIFIMTELKEQRINRKRELKLNSEFIQCKRAPIKPSTLKTDIYVTKKSNFNCHLKKIEKLWEAGEQNITIRALGAAVDLAISLALQFQENHHHVLDFDVSTDSVSLVDDFEPQTDDNDYETTTRFNSSVCIKLIRKIPQFEEKIKEINLETEESE